MNGWTFAVFLQQQESNVKGKIIDKNTNLAMSALTLESDLLGTAVRVEEDGPYGGTDRLLKKYTFQQCQR